jgi:hypothetical protein
VLDSLAIHFESLPVGSAREKEASAGIWHVAKRLNDEGVLVDHHDQFAGLIMAGKDKVKKELPSINKDTTDYALAESALENLRKTEANFRLY